MQLITKHQQRTASGTQRVVSSVQPAATPKRASATKRKREWRAPVSDMTQALSGKRTTRCLLPAFIRCSPTAIGWEEPHSWNPSYMAPYCYSKKLKPLADGEFVKECLIADVELLAPEKIKLSSALIQVSCLYATVSYTKRACGHIPWSSILWWKLSFSP